MWVTDGLLASELKNLNLQKWSFFSRKTLRTSRNPFGTLVGTSSSSLRKKKEMSLRGLEPGTFGVQTQRDHHWTTASHTLQEGKCYLLVWQPELFVQSNYEQTKTVEKSNLETWKHHWDYKIGSHRNNNNNSRIIRSSINKVSIRLFAEKYRFKLSVLG